jgi:hypothetical protein
MCGGGSAPLWFHKFARMMLRSSMHRWDSRNAACNCNKDFVAGSVTVGTADAVVRFTVACFDSIAEAMI